MNFDQVRDAIVSRMGGHTIDRRDLPAWNNFMALLKLCTAEECGIQPEARGIELLLRRASVYVEAKHLHIVTTMPDGPTIKAPCAACDLLAEINAALLPQRREGADK